MEEVVSSRNAKAALKRVRRNGGSPGTDGMTVDELPEHLMKNWETLKAQLLEGSCRHCCCGAASSSSTNRAVCRVVSPRPAATSSWLQRCNRAAAVAEISPSRTCAVSSFDSPSASASRRHTQLLCRLNRWAICGCLRWSSR